MQQNFLHHIKKRKLCTPADKILLTVSGGIDSMVLLDLFQSAGFPISVAHVNFKLRGEESDKDEQFVREKCLKNSIPFLTTSFDTNSFANEKKLSIQMAARELRYQWFNELVIEHQFDWIATAHHLNDSIETTLLNMARGSGLEGWDGIAERNGKIIRPLLFATRMEIEKHAADHQIAWREDTSNSDDDYQRNFVRHRIMPLLTELNSSIESSFQDSMKKILSANELAELGLTEWRNKFVNEKDGWLSISKEGLEASQSPDGLLWNVIKNFGFNLDQCSQMVYSLRDQSGKIFYSHVYELVIDRSELILSLKQKEIKQVIIEEDQSEAKLGSTTLRIEKRLQATIHNDPNMAVIDLDKIKFPLVWRKWREGDFFYPLGMTHKKKLSDFLIDQKVPATQKNSVTVLLSQNEIIWIVGMRIDNRFKIDPDTKEYLSIFSSSK